MNIPTKIKVGAIWWEVKEVEWLEIDSSSVDCGDQNPITQVIRLNNKLSPEMKGLTFLHELLHVINPELEHSSVEMMSQTLYQVLTDNEICV